MDQIARTSKQVGAILRRHRRKLALTQQDLSTRTHLRQGTISRLENGEPNTRLQTLLDILATLELELVVRERVQANHKNIEDIF